MKITARSQNLFLNLLHCTRRVLYDGKPHTVSIGLLVKITALIFPSQISWFCRDEMKMFAGAGYEAICWSISVFVSVENLERIAWVNLQFFVILLWPIYDTGDWMFYVHTVPPSSTSNHAFVKKKVFFPVGFERGHGKHPCLSTIG